MGVKDLWTVLTPHSERKPISELRGKIVAIDLAGWVCESLNVVDYFVHPRHHLKNLFFRTCYLIWEEVTPVFVLEGAAPKLKSQTIAKRNELQFRGVKPREQMAMTQSQNIPAEATAKAKNSDKGRTRFNHVLNQCATLLIAMGIQCVQGPGEAEAYCAYLNKKGLVDGVISQDSDCFAYGAVRVYRNFSVSTQGAQAAQGGAVDIYDMTEICKKIDFGQNKVIVMALLCGCDYCPDGIGGVGRDSVLKLFQKYSNDTVLDRLRSWRREDSKYTALEMRVDDKTICSNCGHIGRTQSHSKSGCGICRTHRGCDESLWKEERLSLKAELALRKKALAHDDFPSEEIIEEFLKEPEVSLSNMVLCWHQPNIIKFIKKTCPLLQWTELYAFQKFFPILTRWQVRNAGKTSVGSYVVPKEIIKKRTVKGVASLELLWLDEQGFFNGLIPDEQLENYEKENGKGLQELWVTIEPFHLMEAAYPDIVAAFLKSKEKPQKVKKTTKSKKPLGSLDNLNDLAIATDEIANSLKPKKQTKSKVTSQKKSGMQMIEKYFKQNVEKALGTQADHRLSVGLCSTPKTKCIPSDLESDCDEQEYNLSAIVDGIVNKSLVNTELKTHVGRMLLYEPITHNLSMVLAAQCLDDFDVMAEKRKLDKTKEVEQSDIRYSLDDSFDVLVNKQNPRLKTLLQQTNKRFSQSPLAKKPAYDDEGSYGNQQAMNTSYFFDKSATAGPFNTKQEDIFEKAMELNYSRNALSSDELILLSD